MHKLANALATATVAALVALVALSPAPAVAADTNDNLVAIEITHWSTDRCSDNGCDVQFRLSVDVDNDGSFDAVNSSQVYRGVEGVGGPIKFNVSIPSERETFAFKVEALRVLEGSSEPFHYSRDGSSVVHEGANIPGFNSSWEYNYPRDQLAGAPTCSLSYRYEVTGFGGGTSADGAGAAGGSVAAPGDPLALVAVGLASAAAGAGTMRLLDRNSGRPEGPGAGDDGGPDAPDRPDAPTCKNCDEKMLREGDFCHHCGTRKPGD